MPLKLRPPRKGKTPNWSIRGTYLKTYVDETTGTPVEATAKQLLAAKKREIERGHRTPAPVDETATETTFDEAALAYIENGGDGQYLGRYDPDKGRWTGGVIPHLTGKPLSEITQQVIDSTAVAMYPHASAATRNRQVHTPISSVLKAAGHEFKIRRPKGWRGTPRVNWMQMDPAFAMLEAAKGIDREFAVFLTFLLYTGCRLNEGLALTCDKLILAEAFAYVGKTKNGDPRAVHLPPFLVAEMANHPRGLDRGNERVFRFRKCGRLYTLMRKVKEATGPAVSFVSFHILCHTWATWMRRYAGLDTRGLVGTGRWRDQKSAARYEHVVASEESKRADLLPTPRSRKNATRTQSPDFPRIAVPGSADVRRGVPTSGYVIGSPSKAKKR